MDAIRFPIGQFEAIVNLTNEERIAITEQIPEITKKLRETISKLKPEQLDVPYRQDGWTIKQIVHHLADNDMNAYLRFKKALTEDEPMGQSYREDLWAELSDYGQVPVENSIVLMETLHLRFMILIHALKPEDFQRKLRTQVLGSVTLDVALQRFVWHHRHHFAQIESLIGRKAWL
ncbi:YfiT family bacillithiol transferase [Cohnella faecalis]|uniref:Putative metal-dependent hydrolase n=1 Tax=Cohnella faecalis TaxID=2315694 RepID=A0A398CWL6_9BACL|nr:putative metal-dependent hydrolase [Cohnella faecalis]RIE03414.1 putative metal-dependent hydrolase [Cohnella faecalis]